MNKLFSKENKVSILITHHTLSNDRGDEGPHMARKDAEGETPGAKGGGEQLRGVHE